MVMKPKRRCSETRLSMMGRGTFMWPLTNLQLHRPYPPALERFISTTSGFTPSSSNLIGTPTTTSYTDFVPAGNYYYLVMAQDAAGNVSAPSNEAAGTSAADTIPPIVSISAPANAAVISGSVTVSA